MKYKVVGWTDYDYNGFKEMPSFNMHAYMTLVREIREKGYRISGYDHQERGWVPVFNTGEIVRMTNEDGVDLWLMLFNLNKKMVMSTLYMV